MKLRHEICLATVQLRDFALNLINLLLDVNACPLASEPFIIAFPTAPAASGSCALDRLRRRWRLGVGGVGDGVGANDDGVGVGVVGGVGDVGVDVGAGVAGGVGDVGVDVGAGVAGGVGDVGDGVGAVGGVGDAGDVGVVKIFLA